ncbi:type II toxin-antitoxin system RelE/ParE family toxin [Poritiphilus flavus]|uniref:Toxin n=1 Tax=Poritiphilus flavus TaxID=2697053 RepID=A0A6L9EGM3_9FLAO|nr:type II toxin-antitoxin system RelE/ParE family toxin [Poritiphilus flavus]NAS13841.1 type II toxin-antitoxin system RelE/ParE family toxin [Poritiphilus flavus]
MVKYRLSQAAEADIAAIADYTIHKFGLRQARKYRDGLMDAFEQLATNPSLGRIFLLQGQKELKSFRYESHVIFYTNTGPGILVLRVLGGMMDFKRHL